MTNKFISHSLKQRNLDEEERTVKVSEEVLNQLNRGHYFFKEETKSIIYVFSIKRVRSDQKKEILKAFDPFDDKEEKRI